MGKTSKWLRRILMGKKEKGRVNLLSPTPIENPASPIAITPNTTPKDRKRWSFRRSPATTTGTPVETTKESKPRVAIPATPQPVVQTTIECENDQQKHVIAMTSATAAVIEEPITAAKQGSREIEEAAAIRIQSYFRSFLARKALRALKGLVKLQALVRGHLVRKQATATLRCMQALVSLQARARAQRTRMAVEETSPISQRQFAHRKSLEDNRYRQTYNEMDRSPDENVKIVEMDLGELRTPSKPRSCYSNQIQAERTLDHRFSSYYPEPRANSKQDNYSPAPSTLTDMSPRVRSGHFEEYPFDITDSSPHYYSAMSKPNVAKVPFGYSRPEYAESISSDYPFFPNYMANTESSKAKVRSQSAPKQRPETAERPPSRRRISTEGRNIPRAVRMQRSISHVGPAAQGYNNHPWSVKPDQSAMSAKDSECGSTSTVLTNTNYCKSLVAYEPHGSRF